jgi:predicted pyridoxine 5'-phosphate oxidase superfamily flavin-nucleotide-binding protein
MVSSPYHAGDLRMQQKTGEESFAGRNGRMVVPHLAPGAAGFIERQPFVIVSSQDAQGRIWSSILAGTEGFIKVKDDQILWLNQQLIYSNPADSFWENIKIHLFIGMLFIEPTTRRRYLVNGELLPAKKQIVITVKQAYANCPKYIQRRTLKPGAKPNYSPTITGGTVLTEELISWIKAADTFFVASSNGLGDMDSSHRGGHPGFVGVMNTSTLRIPDYEGNSMYNTLGNFLLYPPAGLLFLDYNGHRTLQVTGRVTIHWPENPEPHAGDGTNRYWTFSVEEWILLENLENVEWNFLDYSPFNP